LTLLGLPYALENPCELILLADSNKKGKVGSLHVNVIPVDENGFPL
jgi:hypothetical protein